jgi:hypothetical protein
MTPETAIPILMPLDDFHDLADKLAEAMRNAGFTDDALDQAIAAALSVVVPMLQAKANLKLGDLVSVH